MEAYRSIFKTASLPKNKGDFLHNSCFLKLMVFWPSILRMRRKNNDPDF